jgi:iron complex transport system permease protein
MMAAAELPTMGETRVPPSVARRAWTIPALAVLLIAVVVASCLVGSVSISLAEIGTLVLQKVGLTTSSASTDNHAEVLFTIRLPRVLLGVLVGAGLGLSGASMQGIFRNPLVDPGLLGISTGAALGAVASIVLGAKLAHGIPPSVTPFMLPAAAFGGALTAMLAVERISRVGGRMVIATLLLAGIAVNALASALTGFFMYVSSDAQLRTITFWSLGSLGGATTRTNVATTVFLGVPLLLLVRYGRALNALLLGEAEAGHLGIDVERTKRTMIVLVALIVGAAVAVSGVLSFIGLVVPHLLRLAVGPDNRHLLPASALLGASLLLGADAIARTVVTPAELPLGIVTASLGTPFFIALLLRERRRLA